MNSPTSRAATAYESPFSPTMRSIVRVLMTWMTAIGSAPKVRQTATNFLLKFTMLLP